MRWIHICAVLAAAAVPANAAQTETCNSQADEKKLAGSALKSFVSNCRRDAKSTCEESAEDKDLSETARTRFIRKCVRDAVGR
jgi:psiF repeat